MLESRNLSSGVPAFTSDQLIATKLQIPPLPIKFVPRIDLIRRLDAESLPKLTLISAAAGYGKTTLLSEWAAQAHVSVTWLELEERDNHPELFWAYVMVALRSVNDCISEALLLQLQSHGVPSIEAILTALINEIAQSSHTTVLVLDGYHLVTDPAIHTMLAFLLDHLPPQLRLMVASRTTPPLPLARLRALGQLLELCTDDLRFTAEETAVLFNDVSKLNLSATILEALEQRAEGWITGLHLAGLSMNGRVGDSLASLSGTHRYMVEYFSEEIFDRQPMEIQDFLLQTSILSRLSVALCDTLTGQKNSCDMLEKLERENIFIQPLDQARHFYRYHTLFADFLRTRLHACIDPDTVSELHRRAAAFMGSPLALDGHLTDTLSERESEVLHLIAQGLSNQQIAAELVVAVSTVKTHVKSIYRKLNVNSRFDAIKRTHDLALLPISKRPA
jgi:LuxR family maltose regulon positive regulatory protein